MAGLTGVQQVAAASSASDRAEARRSGHGQAGSSSASIAAANPSAVVHLSSEAGASAPLYDAQGQLADGAASGSVATDSSTASGGRAATAELVDALAAPVFEQFPRDPAVEAARKRAATQPAPSAQAGDGHARAAALAAAMNERGASPGEQRAQRQAQTQQQAHLDQQRSQVQATYGQSPW
jgi:hypothetical protein